jgi:hypothetical protein
MPDSRVDPPLAADELTTLAAFLDFNRATLAVKCDGLADDQLRERAVPPSSLSLLGIVRHMADVERNWFRPVLAGEEMRTIYGADMDWEAAFRDAATADVAEAFSTWRAECDHSRALVRCSWPDYYRVLRSRLDHRPAEASAPYLVGADATSDEVVVCIPVQLEDEVGAAVHCGSPLPASRERFQALDDLQEPGGVLPDGRQFPI